MEPTTIAIEHAGPISEIVRIYQTKLSAAVEFDPATTTRNFSIATSDIGSLLILPGLHRWSDTRAPSARFTAVSRGRVDLITGLESGEIDLAVGSFDDLYGSVRSQTVGVDHYVCMMRSDSRRATGPLTLKVFRSARHILLEARGVGLTHQRVERRLVELCPPENIRLVASSFIVGGLLLERDDFILTVPSLVAKALRFRSNLAIVDPPIDLPELRVTQYWHERFDGDPGNQWLRNAMSNVFKKSRNSARVLTVASERERVTKP